MADWQKGDLALCLKGGPWDERSRTLDGYPICGALYTVEAAGLYHFKATEKTTLALFFADAPRNASGNRVWDAVRFIKVTPQSEDAFDREVIAHMAGQEVEA